MPLESLPYLMSPTVHPLCRSSRHEVCKLFEDWNFKAYFPCACPECDHPRPEVTDEMREEAARIANNKTDDGEKVGKRLDYAAMLQLSSPDNEQDPSPRDTEEADVAAAKTSTKAKKATKDNKKTEDSSNRRGRGALEASVLAITDAYEDDKIDLPEGKTLTPHTIANLVQEAEGLENAPSTGAVNAVLKRWDENYGFALTHAKPYAFKAYSARGKKQGLESLKEKHREKMKAERAAAKESDAA